MMAAAAAIAVLAGVGGLYLSYYAGTAAGASIAAVLVGAWALIGLAHEVLGARGARAADAVPATPAT